MHDYVRLSCAKLVIRIQYIRIHTYTVPLDLNFTHTRAQKATARNIHGNAPE